MSYLILIKHSLPDIMPALSANQWHLSAEGSERCKGLAQVLLPYSPQTLVASCEPKAIETAQLVGEHLGITVRTATGLHEHVRTGTPWVSQAEFERQVRAFFRNPGTLVMGRETADDARQRFTAAVETVLSREGDRNTAIVAHGTVIALFVASAVGCEPFALWKRLGMPSFVVLEHPRMKWVASVEEIALDAT